MSIYSAYDEMTIYSKYVLYTIMRLPRCSATRNDGI